MDFQAGDRVRRTVAGLITRAGTLGTVIAIDPNNSLIIRWDDGRPSVRQASINEVEKLTVLDLMVEAIDGRSH